MSRDSNRAGSIKSVLSADERPPGGNWICRDPSKPMGRLLSVLPSNESPDVCLASRLTFEQKQRIIAAASTPLNTTGTTGPALSSRERRALVTAPFLSLGVIIRGHSGKHGGCELPPTVDENGHYHGDYKFRTRRKPTGEEYEDDYGRF